MLDQADSHAISIINYSVIYKQCRYCLWHWYVVVLGSLSGRRE